MSALGRLVRELAELGEDALRRKLEQRVATRPARERARTEAMYTLGMRLVREAIAVAPELADRVAEYVKEPHPGNPPPMKWGGGP